MNFFCRLIQLGIWSALTGAGVGACIVGARRAGSSPSAYGNDFTVFYSAAANVCATLDPYHHPLAERWPYLYPPFFAQILTPLSWLPLPMAAFVWSAGSLVAACLTMRLVERRAFAVSSASGSERETFRLAFAAAFAPLVLGNLLLGQVNLWIAFLITAVLCLEMEGRRSSLAGLALASAIAVKLTPATLFVYLAARRSWRVALWAAGWLAGLQVISFAALGTRRIGVAREWFSSVIVKGWKFNFAVAGNQSLRGAAERFFSEGKTDIPALPSMTIVSFGERFVWAWRSAIVVIVAVTAAAAWRSRRIGDERASLTAAAAACCAVVLVSKLSWVVHFAALALPIGCAMKAALEKGDGGWAPKCTVVFLLTVFWCNSRAFPLAFREWCEAYSLFTGVALGLFAYCAGVSGMTENLRG